MAEKQKGITAKKEDDMPEWYSQVILRAELADYSPVKGCLVIRPLGMSVWQAVVDELNKRITAKGVQNAYFPLFIPESFFEKEKEHAEGFEPEVAWIENKDDDSERLALRPTSETIMYYSYARWIRSWRDLPLRINQWCNIIRWEVQDVKPFLRSREFLWQEGHCVYETESEVDKETRQYLEDYRYILEEVLAVPVISGFKTEKEKFAGAKYTTTVEAFMPDGKALQCGTSHNLGTSFAKAFGITYIGKDEKDHLPWQNSWGLSTRVIGALVMMHSDNQGLVLPPRIAPVKSVIIPILFDDTKDKVLKECRSLAKKLDCSVDDREEYSAGWKFNEWEMRGVPVRIEIGPKDLAKKQAVLVRRDTKEKLQVALKDVPTKVNALLDDIQNSLFKKAQKHLKDSTVEVNDWNAFVSAISSRKLVQAPFCGGVHCEEDIKETTNGVTSRVIPFDSPKPKEKCVRCGKPAEHYTFFSKAY